MRTSIFFGVTAAALAALPIPAQAQQTGEDVAALKAEVARLRGELQRLEARLDAVDGKDVEPAPAPAPVATAPATAAPATTMAAAQPPAAEPVRLPTIKVRGRLQLDTNYVSRPHDSPAPTLGWSADVRRAFIGVEGIFGGGFGYRLEADVAAGPVQFTDTWLTYQDGPLTVTLGNHKTFASLDEITSDLETSLLERAAFTQAFGFERRLGLSATYGKGDVQVSAGIFADDPDTLGSGKTDDSFSLDGRLVYMPKLGDTQLHLAGSLHHRELQGLLAPLQYRARPGARTTDMRFVDTGQFSGEAETGYGLEFAAIRGPFHFASEAFWQNVTRQNLADPTFFGAYGEIGYVFAGARTRSYSKGAFGSIKPTRGLDKGGSGAWQANLRYDWLDLNSTGVRGGTQRTLGASLVWVPVEHVKFLANYLHLRVEDTPVLIGPYDDYAVDVFGVRAQYDF